jgi:hypothetical protein
MELIRLHGVELDQTGVCSEFGRIRSVLLWGLALLLGFRGEVLGPSGVHTSVLACCTSEP